MYISQLLSLSFANKKLTDFLHKKDSEKYSNIAAGKTLKAVFEILPGDVDAHKCILVCEISNDGFSYAIKNDEENMYIAVAVFHFDKSTTVDYSITLQNEIQRQALLSGNFKKVYIMYSLGESILIPFSLYNSEENANALNLVHGDLQSNLSVLTDIIAKNKIYNCYRVSTDVVNIIKSNFPDAINRHQYSVLLNNATLETGKLFIIFYPKKIVLMLIKNDNLQFINSFSYNTAEDVSYILLNTCKQFEVDNIPLEISGLIDENSALFKEIHKYFGSVNFAQLPAGSGYSEEITKQPSHYFSQIFAVDSCG